MNPVDPRPFLSSELFGTVSHNSSCSEDPTLLDIVSVVVVVVVTDVVTVVVFVFVEVVVVIDVVVEVFEISVDILIVVGVDATDEVTVVAVESVVVVLDVAGDWLLRSWSSAHLSPPPPCPRTTLLMLCSTSLIICSLTSGRGRHPTSPTTLKTRGVNGTSRKCPNIRRKSLC